MTRHLSILCLVLLLVAPAASSAKAPPQPPPPPPASNLPTSAQVDSAPPSGIDADLSGALEAAQKRLAAGDLSGAVQQVLRLNLSPDRFSVAQRDGYRTASSSLLRDAARQALAKGAVKDAATAFDGAWILDGKKPDPEYANTLLQWAQQDGEPKGEALYLVRRARQAQPDSDLAAQLDLKLSTNPNRTLGSVVLGTGIAGLVAAAILYGWAGTHQTCSDNGSGSGATTCRADVVPALITAAASTIAVVSGAVILSKGAPSNPVSPSLLPALPEAN